MNTPSPFVPGAKVVLVRYPRWGTIPSYTARAVARVWKNGKIFLEGDSTLGWFAVQRDGEWYASANKGYGHGDLFMADNERILAQAAEHKATQEGNAKINLLAHRLSHRRSREAPLTAEQFAAVEAMLAAFPQE